ncbi:MAG: lysine exporter LysO family protein [Tenuifilaceae bacterium]|nr:lysine exporter LysO family protein [Tenuifilaceae bacterium]
MKGSLTILSFFVLGVVLGLFRFVPEMLISNDYSQWALYLLMFLVGIGIGADPNSLKAIRQLNFKILLVPIVTIVGTTLGVAVIFLLLSDDKFLDLLAVGYGFGYYSLSSIFITELRGDELGVIALLANIMREIITLVAAPIFAVLFGKLAPISAGGATSMDTTLPIITKASGKDYAMISIFHGIVLSVLVPFLVTLVLSWG